MCTDTSQEEIHETRAQYIIDTVRSADDLLIVEQPGRAAAVIISLEEYRRFAAWRKERAERRAWVLERDPLLGECFLDNVAVVHPTRSS